MTWHYAHAPIATNLPKERVRPLGGLLLMKTTRFLAGWGAILTLPLYMAFLLTER